MPSANSTANRIDISMGFDDRYAAHGAAVIASVIRHAPGATFRFIILHAGVGRDRQTMVEKTAPGAEFVWKEIGDKDVPAFEAWGHFTRATLFRLGLEHLAPADCKRLIYLDSDLIVMRDVRELWNTDLKGMPIGGVPDCYQSPAEFAEKWGLKGEHRYFNAGVLLIDLERVRADHSFQAAGNFLAQQGKLKHNDQDALNWAHWGRWTQLNGAWNIQRFMRKAELKGAFPTPPSLVHYIGKHKPWEHNAWHPWSWLYWENLGRTPFRAEVEKTHKIGLAQRARLWLRWRFRELTGLKA